MVKFVECPCVKCNNMKEIELLDELPGGISVNTNCIVCKIHTNHMIVRVFV